MPDYNFKKIEKKWTARWLEDKIYEPSLDKPARPFYNLTMFPYPSAEGLHVGNMYDMVGCDIYGRKKRMEGFDVFQPIGLDGFGIHSENYALKINKHPKELSKITEKRFYEQIKTIGAGFAWDERLETYDPEYYKWTQWIFVQMFKKGLAYRKKATVNWCSKCLTVLADEQVLAGECERCATEVIKKELEQWFFKITDYAEKLLSDLDNLPHRQAGIDWSERIKTAQKNWIGKSEGALITFNVQRSTFNIPVFTTRPDTIFGATYVVLSPEHELIKNLESKIQNLKEVKKYVDDAKKKTNEERIAEGGEKTGVELRGVKAINPANKEEIPVWVADYVLAGYGTGAIMAVPASDARDREFAEKFNLLISDAPLVDKEEVIKKVGGRIQINYHLRDWLISRQRYWGPPIPMIYCERCDWQAVPEEDLPVLLPDVKDFRPTGTDKSPLATIESFVKTKCPKCGGEARRETDVSDTFLDSAWYFFRFIDHKNKKEPFNKERAKHWLPVDLYMGGAEHAVLHLLYTRFITLVFSEWGLIEFSDPFKKFRAHGHITKDGAKMSKSKGNVVNPDEYIKKFGADVLRMYLMFLGPFEQGGDFRDESIAGIVRFLDRVRKFLGEVLKYVDDWHERYSEEIKTPQNPEFYEKPFVDKKIDTILHQTIKKVTEDIEALKYNTAISQLMIFFNEIYKEDLPQRDVKTGAILFGSTGKVITRSQLINFLKLLAPFAPFLVEELWSKLGESGSIHKSKWPEVDASKIKEEIKTIVVQINGKVRDKFEADSDASEDELKNKALGLEKIKDILAGREPKKVIIARNRLVNIVLAK